MSGLLQDDVYSYKNKCEWFAYKMICMSSGNKCEWFAYKMMCILIKISVSGLRTK